MNKKQKEREKQLRLDEKKAWISKYSDKTRIQATPWSRLKEHAMKDNYEMSFWFNSYE